MSHMNVVSFKSLLGEGGILFFLEPHEYDTFQTVSLWEGGMRSFLESLSVTR